MIGSCQSGMGSVKHMGSFQFLSFIVHIDRHGFVLTSLFLTMAVICIYFLWILSCRWLFSPDITSNGMSLRLLLHVCSLCWQRYYCSIYTSFIIIAHYKILWGNKLYKNLCFLKHFSLEIHKQVCSWRGDMHCTF